MKDSILNILIVLLGIAILVLCFVSYETVIVDAVCKSHGFTLGRAQYDGDVCVQEVVCLEDAVIDETCEPIDIGE